MQTNKTSKGNEPISKELSDKIDKAIGLKIITLVLPTELFTKLEGSAKIKEEPLVKYIRDILIEAVRDRKEVKVRMSWQYLSTGHIETGDWHNISQREALQKYAKQLNQQYGAYTFHKVEEGYDTPYEYSLEACIL